MKERIKSKLNNRKNAQPKLKVEDEDEDEDENENENENEKINDKETNEDVEIEEYYLGKDRDDERKRKAYVTLFHTIVLQYYVTQLHVLLSSILNN